MSYWPSPRMSMKDLRSKVSCIAQRSTGLSSGGALVTRRLARPFIGLTSQIACGARLCTCLTSGIETSYGKVISNLPATKARIAVERLAMERILTQSQRRVLDGQAVMASEKLVSLFEPHAEIIVKGARDVQCGHKLNLVTGRSGLILDVVVETGNPADAERFLPMLERQIAHCGVPPRQVAADGGYASQDNLTAAKACGVTDVAFHKKRGLAVEDMVKSRWVYRKLRNFRAGIEAGISCLKRAYGLARCTWRGLDHFKTYVWSAVVAHNLVLLARLKPA